MATINRVGAYGVYQDAELGFESVTTSGVQQEQASLSGLSAGILMIEGAQVTVSTGSTAIAPLAMHHLRQLQAG